MNARSSASNPCWQPLTVAASLGLRLLPPGWHGERALAAAAADELERARLANDLQRLRSATRDDRDRWLTRMAAELDDEHTRRARALCERIAECESLLRDHFEQALAGTLQLLLGVPAAHLTLLRTLAQEAARGLPAPCFVLEVPESWGTLATCVTEPGAVVSGSNEDVASQSVQAGSCHGMEAIRTAWRVRVRADRTEPAVMIHDLETGSVRCAVDGTLLRLIEQLIQLQRADREVAS